MLFVKISQNFIKSPLKKTWAISQISVDSVWHVTAYGMYGFYICSFTTLACICSLVGWFESYHGQTPKDRFSHNVAQMINGLLQFAMIEESTWQNWINRLDN